MSPVGHLISKACVVVMLVTGPAVGWANTALPDSLFSAIAEVDSLTLVGDHDTAVEVGRALLARTEAEFGRRSLAVAEVIDVLAPALIRAGLTREQETRDLAQRAVTIKTTLLGPDDPALVESLTELGYLLRVRGEFGEAEDAYGRALDLATATGDSSTVRFARALDGVGKIHFRFGRYDQAIAAFRRTIAALDRLSSEPRKDRGSARMNLGATLRIVGRFDEAEVELNAALAEFDLILPATHLLKGNAYNNLGLLAKSRGDYRLARQYLEDAVLQKRSSLADGHLQVGTALMNLGMVEIALGELQRAEELFHQSLAILEAQLPPGHTYFATLHNNLGDLMLSRGDFTAAQYHCDRARAIYRASRGEDHPKVALATIKLASAVSQIGDLDQARDLQLEALRIREVSLGGEHHLVGASHMLLGETELRRGDFAASRDHLDQALAIFTSTLDPYHPRLASAHRILAKLDLRTGHLAAAREHLQQCLAICEVSQPTRLDLLADSHLYLGRAAAASGDFGSAVAHAEFARENYLAYYGPADPAVASVTADLAHWRAALGDDAIALDLALGAELIGSEHLRLMARGLAQTQAIIYARERPSALALALQILTDKPLADAGASRRVLDGLIRVRAAALDEICRLQRDRLAVTDSLVAVRHGELALARERLASLTLHGPQDLTAEQYRDLLDSARSQRDLAERDLARRMAELGEAIPVDDVGWAPVQSALTVGQALVSFVRYGGYALSDLAERLPSAADDQYGAFVTRSGDDQPVFVPLGPAAAIDRAVADWRDAVLGGGAPEGPVADRAELVARRDGAALRRLVWDPLAAYLDATDLVFVVPDGALHLINLAALPRPDGGYLVEDERALHILSAERDLVAATSGPAVEPRLLVVGGADFDVVLASAAAEMPASFSPVAGDSARTRGVDRMSCDQFADLRFTNLPRTVQEAEEVAEIWLSSVSAATRVDRLAGAAASERELKERAPEATAIHLATHGFFLDDDCIGAAAGPLLLAGLACSGANNRSTVDAGHDDGILTAEEISSLDLRKARWVVLSACDTGVGEVAKGEGVLGLRRALQVAGAGTVIMSLWPVDDRATRVWMRDLYTARFAAGEPAPSAMRAACLARLDARRTAGQSTHPFHWAGFVATGDWR